MDKRKDSRFPFRMKAFALTGAPGRPFETQEVSAGGALFAGEPGVPTGATMWIRLELGTQQRGRDSLFPLNAEVRVVRVLQGPDQTTTGFGTQWIRVTCRDDIAPLREFLRRTLSISSGFVQTVPTGPGGEGPTYLYVFPGGNEPPPAPEAAEPVPLSGQYAAPDVDAQRASDGRPSVVYAVVPLTWSLDDSDFEGRTVKMSQHAMRVSTAAELPGTYRRVTLTLPTGGRGKNAWLTLTGTVTTQRPPAQEGDEGLFEVTLTLGNDPDSLGQYRAVLDRLAATMTPPGL